MRRRAILCIDGGGVRGLVSSMVLEALEHKLQSMGKNLGLHRYFDIIVGTSAGGIIAAGLTAPRPENPSESVFTASELVDFFKTESKYIFPRNIATKIRAFLEPLLDEKYKSKPLEDILHKHLGIATISNSLTNMALTSYDIETRKPFFISNIPDEFGVIRDFLTKDAVRATTAAPTFFEPANITCINTKETFPLIDGGVFMNDPSLAGLYFSSMLEYNFRNILVVSIGNGHEVRPFSYWSMRDWTKLQWISPMLGTPILSIMSSGQAFSTQTMLTKGLNRNGVARRYIKIDGPLRPGNDDIDDASDENLDALKTFARGLIHDFDAELGEIAMTLSERKD